MAVRGNTKGALDPALVRRAAVVCAALSFKLIWTWLLNVTAYPGFNDFFPAARDIATPFGALAALAFAFVSMYRPRVFATRWFLVASAVGIVAGEALMFGGIACQSAWMATAGSCLRSLSSCASLIYLGVALAELPAGCRLCVVAAAFVLEYVWMAALWFTPGAVKSAAFVLLPVVSTLLAWSLARPTLGRIAASDTPADLAITNPLSFLPFTHRLFTVSLMFAAALGFAITYGSQESYPLPFIYAALPVAVLAGLVLVRRISSPDVLYSAAYVLVLAGLLLVPSAPGAAGVVMPVANTLFNAGSDIFSLVMWFMAASIGARNVIGLIPVFAAWSASTGLGTELGALSGHAVNHIGHAAPELVPLMVAAIVLVFAAHNFFVARRFSFDGALGDVEPMRSVVAADARAQPSEGPDGTEAPAGRPNPAAAPSLEQVCASLAAERGLTARESQVLVLLARGRNVAFIQGELTLSRNTVKSYVASIYAKLGVHSHQEVIDLVEDGAVAAAES